MGLIRAPRSGRRVFRYEHAPNLVKDGLQEFSTRELIAHKEVPFSPKHLDSAGILTCLMAAKSSKRKKEPQDDPQPPIEGRRSSRIAKRRRASGSNTAHVDLSEED
jgi:hypothetical protein